MIKQIRLILIAVFAIVYSSVAAVSAQEVSGSIEGGSIVRGGSARATIVLDIPSELHVNSNTPNNEYSIPTTVRVRSEAAKVGAVRYPKGHDRKFSFSENILNVYEGRVEFGFDVAVPVDFKGDALSVEVTVRYQACNDEECYPPKNKKLTLTATVK